MTGLGGSPKSKEAAAQARTAFLEGRPAEAEKFARRALDLAPLDLDANYLLANALRVLNRHTDAAAAYVRVTGISPRHAGALNEYGAVLFALNRLDEAEQVIGRAIAINPRDASAFNNLARLYFPDPAKAAWALAQADKAISLQSAMAEAHSNRGTALYLLGRFAEAADSHRRAIALKPGLAEAHNNLGNDLQKLGDLDGAVAAYRAAIGCAPGYAAAQLNLALALLTAGQLAEGWQAYEQRWQASSFAGTERPFTQPRWDGRDSAGTLLIWGEQGIGDEILYASLVADLGAEHDIVWEMDARLVPLMQRSFPRATAIARTTPPDAPDSATAASSITAQIPAASLGQYLRPDANAFPVRSAYLTADPTRRAQYREVLTDGSGERLIGISWVSKNVEIGIHKSVDLAALAPVLKMPGLRFVDLQYGDTAAERAEIERSLGVSIQHVPDLDLREDLDGLAALISACDAVVTVSNSTAHLAGALGVPVNVLVPSGNGKLWYWGERGETTPWYPSARLYRQPSGGDWEPAVAALAADLAQGVGAESVARPAPSVAQGTRSTEALHDLFNAGLAQQAAGQLDAAANLFRETLGIDPNFAAAHNNLGAVLQAKGQAAAAELSFRSALALRPGYGRAHYNLGTALHGQGRSAEAAASFREAIRFEPNLFQAHNNLGVMLQELGDIAAAGAAYAQALELNPYEPETLNNRGTLLREAGDFDGAEQSFAAAIAARPQFAEAHRNKALLHLMCGDYAAGWREYAWRWQCPDLAPTRRPFAQGSWDGRTTDAPVLVWGEQGVGDEILYAGMMADLAARGVEAIWEADARLVPLFQRACPAVRVVARATPPDAATSPARYQLPAADLGQFLRVHAADFPRDRAGFLQADPQRAADLRAQFGLAAGERLVGLSWLSYNRIFGQRKSTSFDAWAPVLATSGARFVNLQYGDTAAERAGHAMIQPDVDLRDDLDGVAALIAACDVVVTVSNTTAHLAGALGRPVYVLVPAGGGKLWYWGQGTSGSPWYPSATIFRQAAGGSWAEPIAAIAARLANA